MLPCLRKTPRLPRSRIIPTRLPTPPCAVCGHLGSRAAPPGPPGGGYARKAVLAWPTIALAGTSRPPCALGTGSASSPPSARVAFAAPMVADPRSWLSASAPAYASHSISIYAIDRPRAPTWLEPGVAVIGVPKMATGAASAPQMCSLLVDDADRRGPGAPDRGRARWAPSPHTRARGAAAPLAPHTHVSLLALTARGGCEARRSHCRARHQAGSIFPPLPAGSPPGRRAAASRGRGTAASASGVTLAR
jgi:hypothetical protein